MKGSFAPQTGYLLLVGRQRAREGLSLRLHFRRRRRRRRPPVQQQLKGFRLDDRLLAARGEGDGTVAIALSER